MEPNTLVRFCDGDLPSPLERIYSITRSPDGTHSLLHVSSSHDDVQWALHPSAPQCALPVFRVSASSGGAVVRIAIHRTLVASPVFSKKLRAAAIALAATTKLVRTDNAAARRVDARRETFGTSTAVSRKGKIVESADERARRHLKEREKREKKDAKAVADAALKFSQ